VKIAYFDCFAGISGDMTLGALLDAGADHKSFEAEVRKLPNISFDLKISKVKKNGIEATNVDVIAPQEHHHRHLKDIIDIIQSSSLSNKVKAKAVHIFQALAEAEGKVHGTTADHVHFHEVGAVDAIVDIVGACIIVEMLGIDRIVASSLPMGHGFVQAAHGKIPLPAPATVELLKGVPVYDAGVEGELVTPTGAAILRALADNFGAMPSMRIESVGYGAGKTEFPFPNVLRVVVGEAVEPSRGMEKVAVVETNIDDMNPEFYDSVFDRLFQAGALDVYTMPIMMKKNRPGTLLCTICPSEKVNSIARTILTETSTFGVRISTVDRWCLDRKLYTVKTKYGDIRVKVGILDGQEILASPEYEDCRKSADKYGVSVQKVYTEAVLAFYRDTTS
jgi:uncharacterized protein (TIGR00299 family) protein